MFLSITMKLVFGLIGSLLVVRLLGKKSMSGITPFDLVYMLVLGGILEESTYDDNVHVGHVLFAITLWVVVVYSIERIVQKNEKVNCWVKDESFVLIRDDVINMIELANNHIEIGQLRAILEQQKCFSLENVKHITPEDTGQMGVLRKSGDDKALSILLVDEGQIQHKILQSSQLGGSWLLESLKKEGYADVKQLIYVEWSKEKGFYVLNKEDVMYESYQIDG